MNTITIGNPLIKQNRIEYSYTIEGKWTEAFKIKEPFYIEYSCDISDVPIGILLIPLLCNILPMAWVYNAKVTVPVCDKDFYDSIYEFKKGYIEMYPGMDFGGLIEVGKLQENATKQQIGTAAFFSGGVDAFNTLINHRDEKPTLIMLWGSDVFFDDIEGWERVKNHLEETAALFETDTIVIKSCFRRFLNEGVLSHKVRQSGDSWWHGFQHGIGLIGHAAPVAYALGKKTVYIASSFTAADKGKVTCASDPSIDNYVRFCGANVVHDGYEYTRQDKIHNITQFSAQFKMRIPLRVCWESKGGSNCCNCEKCWRTILGIYSERCDPKQFGFLFEENQLTLLSRKMREYSYAPFLITLYSSIQAAMKNNTCKKELPRSIRWFYNTDVSKLGEISIWRKVLRKIKRLVSVCFQV